MPVQIKNFEGPELMGGPVWQMKEKDFQDAIDQFNHYYKTKDLAGNLIPFPNSKITIPWSIFMSNLKRGLKNHDVDFSSIVLVFTHKYFVDGGTKEWGLGLDCYAADKPITWTSPAGDYLLNGYMTAPLASFTLRNSGMNTETTASQTIDPIYFREVFYNGGPLSLVPPVMHVRSLAFPLNFELIQMHINNGLLIAESGDVNLVIASFSVDCSSNPYSSVPWPHGLAMYFELRGTNGSFKAMMDDNNYVVVFKMKSADYSTLCPPGCGIYRKPEVTSLPLPQFE